MGTPRNAVINDPKESKVFEALSDPQWDSRTVDGISKATSLTAVEVRNNHGPA
jgi:hypothetical protein